MNYNERIENSTIVLLLAFLVTLPWRSLISYKEITLIYFTGPLLLISWIITAWKKEEIYGYWKYYLIFLLVLVWASVSLIWTKNIIQGVLNLVTFIQFLLFIVICVDVLNRNNILDKIAYAYMSGTLILIILEFSMYITKNYSKLGWFLNGPNVFAYQVLISVPFALYFILDNSKPRMINFLALGYLLMTIAGLLLSESRARIVILLIILSLWVIFDYGLKPNKEYTFFLVLPTAAIMYIMRDSILSRFVPLITQLSAGQIADRSLKIRLEEYRSAYNFVVSNPVTGGGLGSAREILPVLESSYTQVSVELGVIGLLLFMMLFIYLLRGTFHLGGRSNIGLYFIVIFILASFFDPVINFLESWFVLSVALVWNRSFGSGR